MDISSFGETVFCSASESRKRACFWKKSVLLEKECTSGKRGYFWKKSGLEDYLFIFAAIRSIIQPFFLSQGRPGSSIGCCTGQRIPTQSLPFQTVAHTPSKKSLPVVAYFGNSIDSASSVKLKLEPNPRTNTNSCAVYFTSVLSSKTREYQRNGRVVA